MMSSQLCGGLGSATEFHVGGSRWASFRKLQRGPELVFLVPIEWAR